jgi:hypothetical protein
VTTLLRCTTTCLTPKREGSSSPTGTHIWRGTAFRRQRKAAPGSSTALHTTSSMAESQPCAATVPLLTWLPSSGVTDGSAIDRLMATDDRSSHGTKLPSGLARRAEAFGVCQDLHGGCRAPPLGADRFRSLIDQRRERSRDHTGVDHPYESGLAESSVRHFRDPLSSLSAVRERMIAPAMAISRPTWSRPTSRPVRRAACHSLPNPKTPSRPNAGPPARGPGRRASAPLR